MIVQVKDNQPTLHEQVQTISQTTPPLGYDKSHNKGRNRDETRIASVFDATDKLTDTEWRPHIKTIIQLQRRVLTRSAATGLWNRSTETAFYVSNTTLGAAPAAKSIRAHWGIENTSHYIRDVTFGEDRSRIRTNPGVFARLRSFAFNILKANKTSTTSQDRYRAALGGIESLLKLMPYQSIEQPWSDGEAMRPLPAALVPQAMRLFGLHAMPAARMQRITVVRCMDGRLLACHGGANLPCGKANVSRSLPGAERWCRQNPDADFVPAYVTGHDTIYRWRCKLGAPFADGSVLPVDRFGFIARYWKPIT